MQVLFHCKISMDTHPCIDNFHPQSSLLLQCNLLHLQGSLRIQDRLPCQDFLPLQGSLRITDRFPCQDCLHLQGSLCITDRLPCQDCLRLQDCR